MPDYVELHARSAFSFLRGGSLPEELAEVAAQQSLTALALCDRNGVYGAPRLYTAAKAHGLRALVGCELVIDGGILPVLVKSRTGYKNLCRLITTAALRAPKGEAQISWPELEAHREGLVALSGDGEGLLVPLLRRQRREEITQLLQKLQRIFGADFYLEVQRHRVPGQDRISQALFALAESFGLKTVATNGVLYAKADGRQVLDVFTCLRLHTHLDLAGRHLEPNAERCLKSPAQMKQLFADHPEAITETCHLAEKLEFTLEDLGYQFPSFPVPAGETMDGYLHQLTYTGARHRYGTLSSAVSSQLETELTLIAKLVFAGYFLIVWDIVKFAREQGILVQGRGSAANSAVCYSLGITAVDPIGGKLLFERFLSEGRASWPDIDLDLPSGERRETVIQEVFQRYGRHGAAMTANVITYRGRSAIREIGKVLNFSDDILKRFSDLFASGDYAHTLELEDQVIQAGVPREHPRFRALIQLYHRVYGLPRHLGQHSGGMVLCQGRLDEIVPLENASMPGRTVVQWDKDDCSELGLIKVDLLGLGMMAVLQDSIELSQQQGRPVDLAQLPKDDSETFALMQRADTIGTFQVESRAQMATLPRMKPACFYDVAIEVAIIRPGPIVGQLVHPYLARRNHEQPVSYIHPDLQPVLERTLGVPLFQEQMLRIAMIMADFNGGEAEELRRAISFHRSDERMKKVVVKLRQNMTRKNVTQEVQDQIVNSLSSFALYGFPESHAISFALIAYASCWLKVHRAAEFYTALLNNQPMGFYSPATLIQDGQRHGLTFRAVCVEKSDVACRIEADKVIRLGFNYVQDLRRERGERIVRERQARPFSDYEDFARRVVLNKTERRVLAKLGAFNLWSGHRRAALWQTEQVSEDLFPSETTESPLRPMSRPERVEADFEGSRVTTGTHPMVLWREKLLHLTRAADLMQKKHGSPVTIGGVVICRQRPGTAKGHVFISLEDETGIANAIVRSELFEKNRLTITHEPFLEIQGRLQHTEGVVSILAQRLKRLEVPTQIETSSYDFH